MLFTHPSYEVLLGNKAWVPKGTSKNKNNLKKGPVVFNCISQGDVSYKKITYLQ